MPNRHLKKFKERIINTCRDFSYYLPSKSLAVEFSGLKKLCIVTSFVTFPTTLNMLNEYNI